MHLAVTRRTRDGRAEPGVVYTEAATVGPEARACADRLQAGSRVGLAGRFDAFEWRDDDDRLRTGQLVVIDQLDLL